MVFYPCKHKVTRRCGLCELDDIGGLSDRELLEDVLDAWDSGGGFALVEALEKARKTLRENVTPVFSNS